MSVYRRIAPQAAAAAVFVVCLVLGASATHLFRWWTTSTAPVALTVSVSSGTQAMRVVNLTDVTWLGCVVTVEGEWQSAPFAMEPGATHRLPYAAFLVGTHPQPDAPTFTQAFHDASVRCRDDRGRWQDAAVR